MGWVMSATGKCYYDHFYVPKKVKQTNNMKHITIERFYELLQKCDECIVELWHSSGYYIWAYSIEKNGRDHISYNVCCADGVLYDLADVYEEKPISPIEELKELICEIGGPMGTCWIDKHKFECWLEKYKDQLNKMEVDHE